MVEQPIRNLLTPFYYSTKHTVYLITKMFSEAQYLPSASKIVNEIVNGGLLGIDGKASSNGASCATLAAHRAKTQPGRQQNYRCQQLVFVGCRTVLEMVFHEYTIGVPPHINFSNLAREKLIHLLQFVGGSVFDKVVEQMLGCVWTVTE